MTASAKRSEAGETTTRPETRFHKKNQAEPVLAQSRVFQQARPFDENRGLARPGFSSVFRRMIFLRFVRIALDLKMAAKMA